MRYRSVTSASITSSRFQPKEDCALLEKLEDRSPLLTSEFGRAVTAALSEATRLTEQDEVWNNDVSPIERAEQALRRYQLDDIDDGKELVSAELLARCVMCHTTKREEITVQVNDTLL
jgi:hypothetical protein